MPPPASAPRTVCPNCQSPVPAGARQCPRCKLEVGRMRAFAAAKQAAERRGITATSVQRSRMPEWLSVGRIIKLVLLLLVIGGIGWGAYAIFGPKPPRYLQFPATPDAAVQAFLGHISTGTDEEYKKSYELIADSARDPKRDGERGDYLQIFDVLNTYLSAEIGDNWINQTQLAPDPNDADTIIAKVGLETLHIHVAQQSPPDRMGREGPHYGITGMDEFNVNEAAEFRKMAGIKGVLRLYGAQGAISTLETVLNSGAPNPHRPRMVRKVELLAGLRNWNTLTWKIVVHALEFREDPVVKARLESITRDDRYDKPIQTVAREVLDDRVTEEEKIAAGM